MNSRARDLERETLYAPGTPSSSPNRAPDLGAKWRSGGAPSEHFAIRVSRFPGPVRASCVARLVHDRVRVAEQEKGREREREGKRVASLGRALRFSFVRISVRTFVSRARPKNREKLAKRSSRIDRSIDRSREKSAIPHDSRGKKGRSAIPNRIGALPLCAALGPPATQARIGDPGRWLVAVPTVSDHDIGGGDSNDVSPRDSVLRAEGIVSDEKERRASDGFPNRR